MNHATDYDEDLDGPQEANAPTIERFSDATPRPTGGLSAKSKRPARQSSFAAVVTDLGVGEIASRIHHLNQEMTLADFEAELSEMKAMVNNNVRPAITAAMRVTGGEYRIETTQAITTGGRMYLLAIVTRLS